MRKITFFKRTAVIILCAVMLLGILPSRISRPVHAATTSQNNIVAWADYLYGLTWVAQSTVYGWNYNYTFSAGSTYRIPYGQPINSGAYIGYAVSIETFLTAANTAGSVFYTSRSTYDSTSSVYYATDCSAFVSLCWGIDRKTTYSIPQVSTYIGMATSSNTSLLQLGDCLNSNDVGHVVLVTGLTYDSSGNLSQIEITEQTPPQLKRSYYTPSELGSKYGSYYGIYRYSGTVSAAPSSSSSGDLNSKYYPACSAAATTFYEGMSEIGVDCDWDLHTRIAEKNGITDFSGTAEQNTTLLNLLKAGTLLNPDYTGTDSGSSSSGGTVTSGSNGYERGYEGGMAGTGEYKAFGLDVSSWQGSDLSFTRIKNAGYDYVILRAGTSNGKDTCFETYYTNAKAAGLDVGAYYYSYATSVSAVEADMEDFLSYISGKKFEYPIYFDYEDSSQQALSASLSQQICLTAMDMLAAEGYLVGMYTGKYFSTQLPIDTICAKYEIWIAHYLAVGDGSYDGTYDYTTYGPSYSTQYGMYQFTDSVWINGYGPYDGDVCYKDYPAIVEQYGFNGYEAEVVEETYFDKCTFYPSRCTFTTTRDTSIFSEPRTQKSGNTSVALEDAPDGTTYTSTGLYVNSGENIFYQVETSDGQTGYIYSGYTEFGKKAYDDIKLSGADLPNGHVEGNIFYVTGTISSTYNTLGTAKVTVYSGFGTSGTAVTGGSATVTNNSYTLDNSDIDNATAFNELSTGKYTYLITVTFSSYYAVSAKELGTLSGTRTLKKYYFTIIDSYVSQSSCSHSNTTTVVEEPTCTDTGVSVVSCSICGLTEKVTTDKTGHSYGSYTVTLEPTCTEAGSKEKTCSVCGKVYTKAIDATGHTYSASSCTEAATCTVCGESSGEPLGHSYVSTVTAPTCTSDGFTTYTCSTCGSSYTEDYVSATGHSWTDATCTAPMTCSTCGTTSGSALGHSYSSVVTKPTCTTGGYTTYTCSTCGHSYTGNQTSATGHSWTEATCTEAAVCTICGASSGSAPGHSYQSVVTAPGCMTDGYTTHTCTTCGHSYKDNYVSASGHSWTDATCTAPMTCSTCGTTAGTALGHSYKSVVTAPECMKDGYTTHTCTTCGHSYKDSYVTATGHSWTEATCTAPMTCSTCGTTTGSALGHSYKSVVTDAGCLTDGYTTHTCTTCGHSYKDSYVTATGHSWAEVTCTDPMTCTTCGTTVGEPLGHTYAIEVTDATCTEDGKTVYTCPCGDSYTETIPATGHSYADGVCTVCGAADPDAVVTPTLTLDHPTLSFESEIRYNVYFTLSDITEVEEMGLITFDSKLTDGTIDDAVDTVSGYIASGTSYMVHTNGIPAPKMGDAVYFKVYAKLSDGSYLYSDVAGYNAIVYARTILNSSTSSSYMKSLVVALLNYGAEAQVYFDYKTDSLMNSSLSASQLALVDAYDESMVDPLVSVDSTKTSLITYDGSSYTKRYSSMSFDGAFALNFYFTTANVPEGDVKMYYWTLEDYVAATTLKPSNASGRVVMTPTGSENQYWGQVPDIAAKQLDETVFVAGFYSYGGVNYSTGVISYSIGRNCESIAAKDGSDQQALAQDTAVYGYYAKQYFENL